MDLWSAVFHVAVSVLVVVLGVALGRFLRLVVVRMFRRLGLNDWFRNFNIGRALLRSGYTAGEFFGSLTAWVIYVVFILLSVAYLGASLDHPEVSQSAMDILNVYVAGFVRFFVISLLGFILVDGFAEYIYKGALSKSESVVGPVAEYIRIILYLVVVTFALEQGGINVTTLSAMLTPITWGLAVAVVAIIVAEVFKKK
ncbi:MAG: hypothetical protein ABWK05_01090 [Pyrobaculum sp.]